MSTAITTNIPIEVTGITSEQQALLSEILRDIQMSVDKMTKAAQKWVSLPEKARKKIVEQTNPTLRNFWGRLEKVGKGELHPLLLTVAGASAGLLGKMPIEDQDKYLRELIPVAFVKGRGWDVKLIDVADLTEDQRKQVFKVAQDGTVTVRDKEAQIAYYTARAAKLLAEEQAAEALRKVERTGWRVERGRVWVKSSAIEAGLTRKQVEQMLKDMGE